METPLVAIITRTKNRPMFLARAMESVLAQQAHDWVHLIVNDGGERQPVEDLIAKNAGRYAGRSQVLHLDHPIGRPAAANAGLKGSQSRLIVFHDDDDTWSPDFLARALDAWRTSGAKGVVTRAEQIVERVEGDRLVTVRKEPFFPNLSAISLALLARDNCFVNLAFLFERDALDAIGLLDEKLPVYDDWDFNLRFVHRFDIEVVPEVLAWYHHREQAAGSARNSFAEDSAKVAAARARVVNRWLRNPETQAIGMLLAVGPTLDAVDAIRTRLDKLFNFMHGMRSQWPLKTVESWLKRD